MGVDYDTLKTFASNEAGQPIPESLVKKMNATCLASAGALRN